MTSLSTDSYFYQISVWPDNDICQGIDQGNFNFPLELDDVWSSSILS